MHVSLLVQRESIASLRYNAGQYRESVSIPRLTKVCCFVKVNVIRKELLVKLFRLDDERVNSRHVSFQSVDSLLRRPVAVSVIVNQNNAKSIGFGLYDVVDPRI